MPSTSASPSAAASPDPSAAPSAAPSDAPEQGPGGLVSALAGVLSRLPGGQTTLSAGTYTFGDFAVNEAGAVLPGGLTGAGESRTVVTMNPGSSTKAGAVPTASGTTNPFYLLKAGGGSPVFRDFTLQGTNQGHPYNGLNIARTTNAQITDVRVNGVPGTDRVNPGETFGINDYRTVGSVYRGVEVDGQGVGASALAFNSSTDPTVQDSYFHGNPFSAGLALWQTHDATLTDVVSTHNRTGINLERTSGTINVIRPTLSGNTAQDFYIGSDQSSVRVNIIDPKITGKIRIRIPYPYWAGAEQQQRSDIHVIVNGVDRTSEMVQWL